MIKIVDDVIVFNPDKAEDKRVYEFELAAATQFGKPIARPLIIN